MSQNKLETWVKDNGISLNFNLLKNLSNNQAIKLTEQILINQKEMTKSMKTIYQFAISVKLLYNFRKTFFKELSQ
ncbi:MAG: hypothetical protein Q8P20_01160 [bacterium]|nr:hypothetical protein [bacterium]